METLKTKITIDDKVYEVDGHKNVLETCCMYSNQCELL
jgi:NADH dehydrogenase/NADH:ubiquinone oxidoreductase subunit G